MEQTVDQTLAMNELLASLRRVKNNPQPLCLIKPTIDFVLGGKIVLPIDTYYLPLLLQKQLTKVLTSSPFKQEMRPTAPTMQDLFVVALFTNSKKTSSMTYSTEAMKTL